MAETLTDNLVEANKEILRLRDEKAALIEALEPFADACESADEGTIDDHGHCWESGMAMSVTYGDFRRAAEVHTRLTRQEGSEEGDRLGRLKVGAGDPKTLSKEGQQ